MRPLLILSAVLLSGTAALAGNPPPSHGGSQPGTSNRATGVGVGIAASRSQALSTSRATGGTARATGGRATSRATGGAGGVASASTAPVTVTNDLSGAGAGGGGGSGYQRAAPSVGYAPAIPPQCGAAISGGGSGIQGTGMLGASWETESCRKHRLAALLRDMGRTDAATALLCTMGEIREAFALTPAPCPVAQAEPVQAALRSPEPTAYVAPERDRSARPEWCFTASREERARHSATCG